MGLYRYKAVDRRGEIWQGYLVRASYKDVIQFFLEEDVIPLFVRRRPSFSLYHSRHDQALSKVFWYLSCALEAGQPLTQSLKSIHMPGLVGLVIQNMAQEVSRGSLLSQACQGYQPLFSPVVVTLFKQGEISGTLKESCQSIYRYLEEKVIQRQQIKKLLFYPLWTLIGSLATLYILSQYVLKDVIEMLKHQTTALPWQTKLLSLIAQESSYHWLGRVGAGIGVLWLLYFLARPYSRRGLSYLACFFPFYTCMQYQCFFSSLCALTTHQVSLLTGLQLSSETVTSSYMKYRFYTAIERIQEGGSIAQSLSIVGLPELYQRMLAFGEQSGHMTKAIEQVALMCQRECQQKVDRLIAILPLVCLGISSLIFLWVVQGLFVPLYEIMGDPYDV